MAKGIFGHLLTTRRFLPLFVTQFISAFNDNIFRNALIILVTFKIAEVADAASWMVPMAAGVFILPYFLFSATAGLMADSHDKARMIRRIKGLEIGIAACAFAAFAMPSVPLLFFTLFLTGVQSAFFGPLKYSILPQHLKENELVAGNAFIETGTFLAILLGTIVGGTLAGIDVHGGMYAGGVMLVLAVCAWLCAWAIPSAPPLRTDLKVSWHIWRDTKEIVGHAKQNRSVYLCILGISWFWLFGGVWLSQFPLYVKQILQADEHLVTLFLTLFSVGIGIGSYICGKILNGQLHARPVPAAALGMTVFTVDFIIASALLPPLAGAESRDVWMFLSDWHGIRIAFDLVMVAVTGGIFIVPLYALLQARSDEEHRSRAVAANNIVNALFMVASSVAVMALNKAGFGLLPVFALLAVGNLAVALFICGLLPDTVLKSLLKGLLRLCFRVEVRGIEHFHKLGERALIVANHQSFLDPPLLAAFLPGKQTFAVNTFIAKHPLIRPFLSLVDAFPMDPTNPLSAKALVEHMREGYKAVIFPEGRITVTGSLMKVYEGPGMIADKADADILPVRIEGAQYTYFSRMKGMVRRRLFPKIVITVLPPVRLEAGEAAGKARRKQIARSLYDVMSHMMFASTDTRKTLAQALVNAAQLHGRKHKIIVDIERIPMHYGQLLGASYGLGWTLKSKIGNEQYVGVMLPNVRAAAAAFFALQMIGRVPAMLNYSAGIAALHKACAEKSGQTLTIHVSTNPVRRFTIDIFRMGYYGGTGGRHITRLGPFPGAVQDDPPIGPNRLRECRWLRDCASP
ncbi:MAG: MFS transporter [Alphaproteobacteria bacterium]|nr:MFS transporter [Alphaproteobacteria bacterium]